MSTLEGQVAIVTGGASGLGRGIVHRLAAERCQVVVFDVQRERGEAVQGEEQAAGRKVRFVPCDVSNSAIVAQAVEDVLAREGRVDVLVNDAGIYPRTPVVEMSEEEWDRVLGVNLKGQFLMARAVAPSMIQARRGRIIGLASGRAFGGAAKGAHYSASKHGVRGLTKSLALELAPYGITVNAIAPGISDTEMPAAAASNHDALLAMGERVPLGRIGRPEDIAGAVVFLAGPDAAYMTGQTILVNGGAEMP